MYTSLTMPVFMLRFLSVDFEFALIIIFIPLNYLVYSQKNLIYMLISAWGQILDIKNQQK